MRINEIIKETAGTSVDPILNDPNLYKLLEHYLGKSFIQWAKENSPYTMSGRNGFEQMAARLAQPTYNNVAASIIPLAAQEEPDIERIIRIVFRIPGFVSQSDKIRILDTIDRKKAEDAKSGWTFREKQPPMMVAANPDHAP